MRTSHDFPWDCFFVFFWFFPTQTSVLPWNTGIGDYGQLLTGEGVACFSALPPA